ncbi:MAG TPA: TonB-dependent receptor [Rhodocyclaceae bacterium]|nr:TonB-dependent receptor [Rhodocyclaceae bacterium]HMV52871.1 TonB-dependent receptor [Rhodocyclaceae bacterium]HMZ83142.1 TonB-dependent receptor [Rhodocyclaceae bacterium]HNA04492.1 TonB-dependent receptor [Rhodocyclaceae bacterium]HNB78043.1 TonB-dependent receptor [Rhodocyclaceae bacterium]
MHHHTRRLIGTCLLLTGASAYAQEGTAARPDGDSTFTLGTVVVSAKPNGPLATRSVLSSVDVLGANLLQPQNVDNTWELFGRAPGVMLTEFNQGTTSGKLSFRAFNGEGEVNAVKLLIDGIPSNSNDGNMPYIDMIFPLEIEAIEVVRGTNDPRYGLYNIAGNANIVTRTGGNYLTGRAGIGSFATRDAQLAAGMDNGRFSQNYFAGYHESDGYREHSKADKFTLGGKWFIGTEDGRLRAGLVARHYENDAEEPGYLTRTDAHRDPEQSYAFSATDASERRINHVGAHVDAELADNLFWNVKSHVNRLKDRRWVKFSAGVSQQERVTDERHSGAMTTLTWRPQVSWLADLAIEGGADIQKQENKSLRYNTLERVRQRQTRDQAYDLDVYGGYLQAVVKPIDSLKLIPAYRVDKVRGDFDNRLAGTSFNVNDYGPIRQPKFSAVWSPNDAYSAYANWGRSFQIGVGASSYKIPPRVRDLEASINEGWEAGLKFAPAKWIDGRIAYWVQTATGEERRRLNDPSNESDNIGSTRRKGYDVQVNLRPTKSITAWLAYAHQDSEIEKPDPTAPSTRGNEIDHVPHHLYSGGIDFQATEALLLSISGRGQSDYYLERSNSTGKFGGFFAVDLGATYKLAKNVSLEFQVKNLTDRYYEYVWWDGVQSLHSPADERSFHAAVSISF